MSDGITDNNINKVLDNISKQIKEQNIEIKIDTQDNESPNINNSIRNSEHNDPSPLTYIKDENEIQWTEKIEEEIKKFSDICKIECDNTRFKAKRHYLFGRVIQITLIILGSLSVYSSASSIEIETKNIINIFTGFSTTVISSIYTIFGFTKKATIEFEASLGLDNISKMLKYELLKPIHQRKSPFDLIYFSNMSRDKIVKKLGM